MRSLEVKRIKCDGWLEKARGRFLRKKQVSWLAFCTVSDMRSNKIKCIAVYLGFIWSTTKETSRKKYLIHFKDLL